MNIFRLAGELFLIYVLYQLIFKFIIPVYHTTKQVKKQFDETHKKMNEQMNTFNRQQAQAASPTSTPPKIDEEYIEYEEIKK